MGLAHRVVDKFVQGIKTFELVAGIREHFCFAGDDIERGATNNVEGI
jgi:hypothetical protein